MAELVYDRGYYFSPSLVLQKLLSAAIGIVEFLLVLRFVFELLNANPTSVFVAWLYGVTNNLVIPFSNAFPNVAFMGFTIDIAVILAMVAYGVLASIIGWLLSTVFNIE